LERAAHEPRAQDDQRLVGLRKHAWLESGGVYGYRKITLDMRDLGERCGKHRVARLLKREGLRQRPAIPFLKGSP
jgi:putative transposase